MNASAPKARAAGAARAARAALIPRALAALLAAAAFLGAGCALFVPVEREFASNEALLQSVAERAHYVVEPRVFTLVAADVRDDSLTLQYRGREHPGDIAWVVRFSQKSTEQNPVAISEVVSLLPVLAEGRAGFAVEEEGTREAAGGKASLARYRFDSPVHDQSGKPFPAHGIIAVLTRNENGRPVVYHFKLDNHGDRDGIGWGDLEPFLAPLGDRG